MDTKIADESYDLKTLAGGQDTVGQFKYAEVLPQIRPLKNLDAIMSSSILWDVISVRGRTDKVV
ncbi:uncharacterized protein N7473_004960 [Penicillium subrubescens]|nr:uncharacterized protein N7473_004960 [Penicillium subrubescens]KAJ5900890.1 hypothetical protein N7473_004960 [Penicillium subrubescens]